MRQYTEDEIKMVEKAVEMQEGWQPDVGDFYAVSFQPLKPDQLPEASRLYVPFNRRSFEVDIIAELPFLPQRYCVHLPLEHQLLEMVDFDYRSFNASSPSIASLDGFFWWGYGGVLATQPREIFDSFWSFLLGFVMAAKYRKRWDSEKEDWVKV